MPQITAKSKTDQTPVSASPSLPCCASLRVLRLTLKRQWFDMIAAGIKKEEYRTPGKWINSRIYGKEYDVVEFKNGYGANVPTMIVEYKGHRLSTGNAAWGAQPGNVYHSLKLGKVISLHNH